MNQTRSFWVKLLWKIAGPVVTSAANGTLKTDMPVEALRGERAAVTHLEAIGRTVAGLAPWLETPAQDPEEEALRVCAADRTRKAIANAVRPDSVDFCNFSGEPSAQPLVDAAFLAQGILRAPTELWQKQDEAVRRWLVDALRTTRCIPARRNNWLLFPAMIEAALYRMTGEWESARVEEALCAHEQWYHGDGVYGDGPELHWDYYNSYVIQPMLVDLLRTVPVPAGIDAGTVFTRSRRYAALLERQIAPDGSFPPVGRSLTYRSAAFQTLAQMALLNRLPDELPPAQVRCALTAMLRRCFSAPNTFDADGWLTIGLCGHQPALGEAYISTGSLYLCTTGFLPLGLPESHPFWRDADQPYTAQKVWCGENVPVDHALRDRATAP